LVVERKLTAQAQEKQEKMVLLSQQVVDKIDQAVVKVINNLKVIKVLPDQNHRMMVADVNNSV
jgi:hypothetical protein